MNTVFTIIATSLSVSAFAFIFFPDKRKAAIIAFVAFLLCLLSLLVEHLFKKNGSQIINAVMYFFTKNREFLLEEKIVEYARKNDKEWVLKKRYRLKSKCRALEEYDDRFSWSANSAGCEITSLEKGQQVTRIRGLENWTFYTIVFDHSVKKGATVDTGSIVSNLIAEPEIVRPYLSITITEKTSRLKLSAKIPAKYGPRNGTFSVYSSPSSSPDSLVLTKKIEYSNEDESFSETIIYPRKNWKYVITWEY